MTEQAPEQAPEAHDVAEAAGDDGAADVAALNRSRMREALDRKRGVAHPDDAAQGGSGGRGAAPGAAKRDFSRRKSG